VAFTFWKSKIYESIKLKEAQTLEKNFHRIKNGEFERDDRQGNVVNSDLGVYFKQLLKTCFIAIFDNRCRMQYGMV
jgi:hypothetical protein